MNHHLKQISAGMILWITTLIAAHAKPEAPAPKNEAKPGYEITKTEIKLPGVTIDRAAQEVRIDATVCLEQGILEYVVCSPDTFEHESIFSTKAKPELLHAALLLCGLKPTPQVQGLAAIWNEKAMKQKDSRIKIEVEWKEEGIQKRVNLVSLLRERQDLYESEVETKTTEEKKPKKEAEILDPWIFAGSFLQVNKKTGKPFYVANYSGILVGIWPNPTAVIQYGLSSGNPYEGNNQGLEINEENIPKLDTKVKLVFSKHTPPIEKNKPKGASDLKK